MPPRNKQAAARQPDRKPGAKHAVAQAPAGDGPSKPTFSFAYADRKSELAMNFALHDSDAKRVLEFICEMGALTWNEIRAMTTGGKRAHRKHHEMDVNILDKAAQSRWTARGLDEIASEAFRFRLGGKPRLWGFVAGGAFHVVWWDPEHRVYPSDP